MLKITGIVLTKKGLTSKTWRLLYYKDILADGFFQYNFAAALLTEMWVTYWINCWFNIYLEYSTCLYLILNVVPAARNLKHWLWEAANRVVRIVKVRTLKNRCLFLLNEVVEIPLHQEVRAVAQDVPVAPAPVAVHVIRLTQSVIRCQLKEWNYK